VPLDTIEPRWNLRVAMISVTVMSSSSCCDLVDANDLDRAVRDDAMVPGAFEPVELLGAAVELGATEIVVPMSAALLLTVGT